jgi:hypothetical protein
VLRLALRQASLQYFTSSQFLAQLLRHTMSRPQTQQGLEGNDALLPLNPLDFEAKIKTFESVFQSGFFSPGAAPALTSDLFACKQGACGGGIAGFALVERAVAALLFCGVFGVFGFVGFGT